MVAFVRVSAEHSAEFIIPESLEKKDWLMCSACGLPQYLFEGCCLDPDCEPHKFRVDWGCVHCGCPLDANADSAAQYNVAAGKAERKTETNWRKMQRASIRQYNSESVRG